MFVRLFLLAVQNRRHSARITVYNDSDNMRGARSVTSIEVRLFCLGNAQSVLFTAKCRCAVVKEKRSVREPLVCALVGTAETTGNPTCSKTLRPSRLCGVR